MNLALILLNVRFIDAETHGLAGMLATLLMTFGLDIKHRRLSVGDKGR